MASVNADPHPPLRLPKRSMIILVAIAFAAIVFTAVLSRHALVRFAVQSLGFHLDLGYTVRFVMPDGFHGVFTISEDPVNGIPPGTRVHGEVIYSIPESGHLVTTDITPLMTWHTSVATYKSGKVIGFEGDPSEIRLRGVTGFGSDGKSRTLIGTNQQLNDWFSNGVDWFRIENSDENNP
jgi:hypothetical protein